MLIDLRLVRILLIHSVFKKYDKIIEGQIKINLLFVYIYFYTNNYIRTRGSFLLKI